MLNISQKAARRMLPRLALLAGSICDKANLPMPRRSHAYEIYRRYALGVPADEVQRRGIADIVNAGWIAYLDNDLWRERPEWFSRKFELINQLVFKSMDVLEFRERTRATEV